MIYFLCGLYASFIYKKYIIYGCALGTKWMVYSFFVSYKFDKFFMLDIDVNIKNRSCFDDIFLHLPTALIIIKVYFKG